MESLYSAFMESPHALPFMVMTVIFLVTIFFVALRWLRLSTALFILLISLSACLVFDHLTEIVDYFTNGPSQKVQEHTSYREEKIEENNTGEIEALKSELQSMKEHQNKTADQVKELLDALKESKGETTKNETLQS